MRELKDLLPPLPASKKQELAAALHWRRSVGAELSRQLLVQRVARGTLFVEASDLKWVHAVLPSLGSRWRAQPGGTGVKRVRFLMGGHTVEEVVLSYDAGNGTDEGAAVSIDEGSANRGVRTHRSLRRASVPLGERRRESAPSRDAQHGWTDRLKKVSEAIDDRKKD